MRSRRRDVERLDVYRRGMRIPYDIIVNDLPHGFMRRVEFCPRTLVIYRRPGGVYGYYLRLRRGKIGVRYARTACICLEIR